jgi:membrane fusion protein, multidrug efflux system
MQGQAAAWTVNFSLFTLRFSMNTSSFSNRSALWTTAVAVTAIVAAVALVFVESSTAAEAGPSPAAPAAIPVSVATVAEHQIHTWDEFSGRLEAVEHVDVRSRVAGSVQAVHFREGALVKKGSLLITIDPAPYRAEVERSAAQLAAAQARVAQAISDDDRAKRLWTERAIAQRELDQRANALLEAQANLRAAQAALQSTELNLSYTQVRAPISGRVGKLEVTVGNLVAAGPGAPVLTTVVSIDPIYASFDADERVVTRALNSLSGQGTQRALEMIPVQMGTADSAETPFLGTLQLVDNQVDPRSGTVRVRAVFDNADGRLMPGQFARLRMGQAQTHGALLVSDRAVGTDQDKKFVLVVGNDNTVAYREVHLGATANGMRIVTQGLVAGERMVVNGLQRVRPGALVAPQSEPVAPKAAATEQAAGSKS